MEVQPPISRRKPANRLSQVRTAVLHATEPGELPYAVYEAAVETTHSKQELVDVLAMLGYTDIEGLRPDLNECPELIR